MIIARIEGFTRALGAPAGWNHESSGSCGVLPIRDQPHGDQNSMVSAWEPTADEISAIVAGAKIYLSVVGYAHPPVMLSVGPVPVGGDAS